MEKFMENHPFITALLVAPVIYFLLVVVMSF